MDKMPENYVVPTVIENTNRGERAFDIYSRLLKDRIIFLGTPIDDTVSNLIMAQFFFSSLGHALNVSYWLVAASMFNTLRHRFQSTADKFFLSGMISSNQICFFTHI